METYTITFISFLIYFFLKQKAQQVGDVQKLKSMTITLPITIHNSLPTIRHHDIAAMWETTHDIYKKQRSE
jgi:hypothetical protein